MRRGVIVSASMQLTEEREGRNDEGSDVLKNATPYPWGRDAIGNLVGANGHAIYFMGEDSVLVEHAPVMLETIISIYDTARQTEKDPGDSLDAIWCLADSLICAIERSNNSLPPRRQIRRQKCV